MSSTFSILSQKEFSKPPIEIHKVIDQNNKLVNKKKSNGIFS